MGLINRALNLYRAAGLCAILKQVIVALRIYENHHYYLFLADMKPLDNESKYLPKINVNYITHKTVSSPKQLDDLIADGFTFEGQDLDYHKYVIGKGVWGDFLFVGKELACFAWTATTKEGKGTFDKKPYKVDFTKKEACVFAWTHPKYRNQGLSTYLHYKSHKYLSDRGIKRTRVVVDVNNAANLKKRAKVIEDAGPYAKGHFLRVLGFKYWKETPLNNLESTNIDLKL